MAANFDPYRELGLSAEAANEPELVRAAFKALAKKYHPDGHTDAAGKARAEEKMRRLNEAQRLILSGEYRPSPPVASASLVSMRPSEPSGRAGAVHPSQPAPGKRREVPMGPMLVAVLVLILCLVGPIFFSRDHLAEARRLEDQGKNQQALEEANQALLDDPREFEGYLLRARLWQKLGQPERARVDLANAKGRVSPARFEEAQKEIFPTATPSPGSSPTPKGAR